MTTAGTGGGLLEPASVGVLGIVALAVVDPPDSGAPWCPSVLVFSTPCPLCGLTRGVARLVRGELAASLGFHPLAWLVLVIATGAWIAWFGRRAGWWQWRSVRLERNALWVLTVGLLGAWVVRSLTGTLPLSG